MGIFGRKPSKPRTTDISRDIYDAEYKKAYGKERIKFIQEEARKDARAKARGHGGGSKMATIGKLGEAMMRGADFGSSYYGPGTGQKKGKKKQNEWGF